MYNTVDSSQTKDLKCNLQLRHTRKFLSILLAKRVKIKTKKMNGNNVRENLFTSTEIS